jgi:hypothetical protein
MRRLVAGALLVLAIGPPAAHAELPACRQSSALFLRYGVSNIEVQRVSCRRAVRTLGRWSRAGRRGRGPSGWRCSRHDRGPFERVRCRRAAASFTFDLGGA